ncbi:MAG: DNA methylase, partial [Thermoplasmata archaeon]|nr:DNA methylase [Thermoplasmata archaeon]
PLGFYSMEAIRELGFKLKSIVVKNIEENRGKRGQRALWRYRALKYGYYVFKHEYIMFFVKK